MFVFLMTLLLTLGALSSPAQAATTIIVTTTDDELNSDGDCALREAIQAANTDTAVDACPAGSGDDAITLGAGSYTLTLAGTLEDNNATGDLDIVGSTGDLTVNGAGASSTIIDGGGIDRVLHILNGTATINDATVTNGLLADTCPFRLFVRLNYAAFFRVVG